MLEGGVDYDILELFVASYLIDKTRDSCKLFFSRMQMNENGLFFSLKRSFFSLTGSLCGLERA